MCYGIEHWIRDSFNTHQIHFSVFQGINFKNVYLLCFTSNKYLVSIFILAQKTNQNNIEWISSHTRSQTNFSGYFEFEQIILMAFLEVNSRKMELTGKFKCNFISLLLYIRIFCYSFITFVVGVLCILLLFFSFL